jgi:3-isopropylmalate dehydrogenase
LTALRVAVLPGDGIGPEVTREAVRVLQAMAWVSGFDLRIDEYPIGAAAIQAAGTPLPDETRRACLSADAVLLGAVGDPACDHLPPADRPEAGLLALRQALGGFANLRPARCLPALVSATPFLPARVVGADLLVVRELLGGLYYGEPRGIDLDGGRAWNTLSYTRAEIARVAHVAFAEARGRRGRVTSVDKANVLETSQLWRAVVSAVSLEYPDVQLEHMYVDACALRLAVDPAHFDVVLTDNLFGDILSDQAASVAGSLGMLPSATLGGRVALYEPVHGSAPALAGRNEANPIGAILCVAMLLRHSARLTREAAAIEEAVQAVVTDGVRTPDVAESRHRSVGTRVVGEAIECAAVELVDRHKAYHGV